MEKRTLHPVVIRITHWLNVVALYIMVGSGLRIYNASPIFDWAFPNWITIGGWLAGARQWHFFAMWIFAANGLVWVLYNVVSLHGRTTTIFRLSDRKGILPMVRYYLRMDRTHPVVSKYNALQKLAYSSLPIIAAIVVLSGLAIYWPVQLQALTRLFGNYDSARVWHFFGMAALVLFFAGHLVMVVIAGWNNFISMITGKGYYQHEPSENASPGL